MTKPSLTVLALGLVLACPAAQAAPISLTLDQLDAITAGGGILSVSILAVAMAQGPRSLAATRAFAADRPSVDIATAIAVAYGTVLAETGIDPQASGGTIDLTGERTLTLDHGTISVSYGYAIAADSVHAAQRALRGLAHFEIGALSRLFVASSLRPGW
jgi:hypothetical protein